MDAVVPAGRAQQPPGGPVQGYEPLFLYRRVLFPHGIAYCRVVCIYGIAYRRVVCPCGIVYRSEARLCLQAAHSNLPEAQYKVMNLFFAP